MTSRVLAIAALLLFAAAPAWAADAPGPDTTVRLGPLLAERPVVNQTLTIDEAVALALQYSPALRATADAAEEAEGRLDVVRGQTLPTLSANTFVSGGSESSIVSSPMGGSSATPQMIMGLPHGAFVDQNVLLMVPLYTAGRLSAQLRQATALRSASAADAETQGLDTIAMTRAAFRAIVALRAMVDVQTARVHDSAQQLRLDRIRLEQQQVPAYYVQRDEAATAAATQDLTNAQRDLDIGLVQLKTVMGVSPASRIEVTGGQEVVPSATLLAALTAANPPSASASGASGLSPDLEALLTLAERQRPELRAAGLRVQGASASAAATRAMYGPQVNLFGMNDVQNARGQNTFGGSTYGVAATLPLYDGGQRRADTRAADAAARREEDDRQRIALQVAQDVETALLNLRAAEQNIGTVTAALTSARTDYDVAQLRYQAGRSIVTEVLDALAARVQAEANVVQAEYQYNLACDQLRRAVGQS
jgi:outer membrane protein TolC